MNICPVCKSVHRTIGHRNCVINLWEDEFGWHSRIFFPNGREVIGEFPRSQMEDAIDDAKGYIDSERIRDPPQRSGRPGSSRARGGRKMSDSGRQIGDCQHGNTREWCVECLRKEVAELRADKERLDWLEGKAQGGGMITVELLRRETGPVSLRRAIDIDMEHEKGGGK